MLPDHVPMCISIPPKHAVANVVSFIKGMIAIQITRRFSGMRRNLTG
ncbi:MAG: transposase [Candidatus Thiodiazotropha sp.]